MSGDFSDYCQAIYGNKECDSGPKETKRETDSTGRRFRSPIPISTLKDVEDLYGEDDMKPVEIREGETLVYTDEVGVRREISYSELDRGRANKIVDQQVQHWRKYSKDHKDKSYEEVYREYLDRYPLFKAKIAGLPVHIVTEG